MYLATENTDCCTRNCLGSYRPFDMKVLDLYNNEIIHFYRPLACSGCCFPCCLQSIDISSPPGKLIGRVKEEWSILSNNYSIKNHLDETILRIEGPCCTCKCCNDVDFKVWDRFCRTIIKFSDFLTFVGVKHRCFGLELIDRRFAWKSSGKNFEEMDWVSPRSIYRCRYFRN